MAAAMLVASSALAVPAALACAPRAAEARAVRLSAGLLQKALAAHKRGEFSRAIHLYGLALEADRLPAAARAALYHNRASAYVARRLPERALADLDQALALEPGRAASLIRRAELRLTLGQSDAKLARAVTLDTATAGGDEPAPAVMP